MVSSILAPVVALVLVALGILHLLWAMGSTFPAANGQELARMVVGRRGITRMPPAGASLFVAICLFLAAILALTLGRVVPWNVPPLVLAPVGLMAAAVFAGRGIVGILPAFERAAPEQPFLKLNRRIYSPLSFLIGVGFLLLTLSLPHWSWRLGLLS